MSRKKITVIGAGNIGAAVAAYSSAEELGDVVVLDILEGVPEGKSLDLLEAAPILGVCSRIVGTNDYRDTADSDVVIMTAGIARKPGMSRDDLLKTNVRIVSEAAENAAQFSPNAILIVLSNPLDAMVYAAWEKSGFHWRRVIGSAGALDSARFRAFVAAEIGVSPVDIQAIVIGGHGDTMLPLVGSCNVGGIPVNHFLGPERIEEIVQRTRDGGAEIVRLLKTGSAYYAPAAAAVELARSVLLDQKRLLPVSTYVDLHGEFGRRNTFCGVPAIVGAGGIEQVIQLPLTEEEENAFKKSLSAVCSLMEEVDKLL